jgi:WD40 repeat protein
MDQVCDHLGAVKCLSYDKSGKLYSGGADGILRIWTLPANRQPRKLELYSV